MLPDWQIQRLVWPPRRSDGEVSRTVFVPEERAEFGPIEQWQIQPASLDVRLSWDFINHKTDERIRGVNGHLFLLMPGDCVLASLVERFSMPDNLVARVEGKSSWAREFLTVHSAGFIDPGFQGDITLELKNDGHKPLYLPVGRSIAQVSFQSLAAPARRAYGSEGLGSHYQNQNGTTRARS